MAARRVMTRDMVSAREFLRSVGIPHFGEGGSVAWVWTAHRSESRMGARLQVPA